MRIEQIRDEHTDDFFRTILELDNLDECYAYFDDLMTLKEMKTILQRFRVAESLLAHKTYQKIEAETQASTAIISRVKRSLEEGNHTYEVMIERLAEEKEVKNPMLDENNTDN